MVDKEITTEPEKTEVIRDEAKELLERQEKLEADRRARLEREEALQARRELGGQAEAGAIPIQKSDDEKYREEAKARYEGTGLDPTEDDSPTVFK